MSVLVAVLALSPLGSYPNPRISTDLDAYAVDYWPAHQAAVEAASAIALARTVAAAHPRALGAVAGRGYMDDYYFRIHLTPSALALGTLANAQTRTVDVWNAWPYTAQTLTSTTLIGDEDIVVTAPATFPVAFAPVQNRTWIIGIDLAGAPQIAAMLTYTFADATQTVALPITGERLAMWPWLPDWTNGITERLSWKTDVLQSPTGAEQRRALRLAPRVTWDFDALVVDDERSALEIALFAGAGRKWGLPVWHDVERLGADIAAGATVLPTAGGRDYAVGGLVMLRGDDAFTFESAEILTVAPATITLKAGLQQAWPAGSRMWPARIAQLIELPQIARETDTLSTLQVQMQSAEPIDYAAAAPTTLYRGLPVVETAPVEGALTGGWQRISTVLDNDTGLPLLMDTAGVGFAARQHAWMTGSRAEHNALRGLLYALAGRWKAAWWPTFAVDFRLVAAVGPSDTAIRVRNVGYARLAAAQSMRRDIRIELGDGTALHRRILAASIVDAGTEQLALDAPLGVALAITDVRRISFLTLCRLDADDIELHHDTDADGVTECTLPLRALRDDLEAA